MNTAGKHPVRTRFAPSPTGYLHVGGLRTALYNYLFAKANNGSFILRIEDTDQARTVAGAQENLIQSLAWAGLNYDEGPDNQREYDRCDRGEYGPYLQSARLDLYQEHAKKMLNEGNAYHCFCTPQELDEMRAKQKASGQPPRYDGRCRRLKPEQVQAKIKAGIPSVVRMKIKYASGDFIVEDLIRGSVRFKPNQIDDQVILKSDGYPTYHLANVVDDHHMGITHVIRGEEWLPSTPKHLQLYEFLGWEPPHFAHLPLLLNADRSKLSKRQGDVATEDYKNKGILPEALINFVALLGWNTSDEQEIFSLDELTSLFSIERIGKGGAIFDRDKLLWFNSRYIKAMEFAAFKDYAQPFLPTSFVQIAKGSPEVADKMLHLVKDSLDTFAQIEERLHLFLDPNPEPDASLLETMQSTDAQTVYRSFLGHATADESEWGASALQSIMKQTQKATKIKGKALWIPMRMAITLSAEGPELALVCDIFGKEKTLQMVRRALCE